MEKRTIAGTDLAVSRVCFGTMTFGAQTDEAAAAKMLDLCLERGVNFFDVADVYNNGRAEEILGRLLQGRRDRLVLASKVGMNEPPGEARLAPAVIRRSIDESLSRLGTDRLEIYYLHRPDYVTPMEESLAAVDEAARQGKFRYLGVSNFSSWQVCRLLWLAKENDWPAVRIVQPMYNVISRGIEPEFLPMCRAFGLATASYNPLAGGLLTGKHRFETTLPGTRFDGNQVYRDRYWYESNFHAVGELEAAAKAAGTSLVGLALRWNFYHTAVDCVILGASRLEQLQENLDAIELGPLPPETVEACDRVWQHIRGDSPLYFRAV